jgi:hypothetical protein
MGKLWSAYKQLLRAEALFGLGFFGGCLYTGLVVAIGHIAVTGWHIAGFLAGLGRLHP